MKQIQVTDDMYDFLMNLSEELNAQDHRCTAMPYFFQVRQEKSVPAYEGCGSEVWYNSESDESVRTKEEKVEWLYADDYNRDIESDRSKYSYMDEDSLDELLEDKGFDRFNEQTEYIYSNSFLTAQACENHIKANDYHYNNPVCYLSHAFRNPEMKQLMKFLCELSGGKIHK